MMTLKVKLKNTYYPKPLLYEGSDDYVENIFHIDIISNNYDTQNQKYDLEISVTISNPIIRKYIDEKKIAVVLHIEQRTQRDKKLLTIGKPTTIQIDLMQYTTYEPIELLGILVCKESFTYDDRKTLNPLYEILSDPIEYERGDIIGFSNDYEITLPEDKRIGSIFYINEDKENILKGQPFNVSLDGNLIQILMEPNIHNKFANIYNRDAFVKKLFFFSIVEPSLVTAFTEMFLNYESYKDKKWCITLSSKIEKKKHISRDELFLPDNYDIGRVYEYVNIALGSLYKDSIDFYDRRGD